MFLGRRLVIAAATRKGLNMSEAVQFWLDNKVSTGIKVAGIGDQSLVLYRDKYYLVEKGAAHMSGRKPLRYSKSSMPTIWKKALSGEEDPVAADVQTSGIDLPCATGNTAEREKRTEPRPPALVQAELVKTEPVKTPVVPLSTHELKPLRKAGKLEKIPATQAMIIAKCPYCSNENKLSPEKGKAGKSFFFECERCRAEFAVRIVPVMIYQAQVAGFR